MAVRVSMVAEPRCGTSATFPSSRSSGWTWGSCSKSRPRWRLGVRVGLSSVFVDFADTRIAAVEATDVLATARHAEQLWNEFEGTTLAVLTRSRQEASHTA